MVSKRASRCARGSMRKVLRKHHARGSSCGSFWRRCVRLETLFAEAPAKKSFRKGLWKQDALKCRPRGSKSSRKLAGGRVVNFQRNLKNHSSPATTAATVDVGVRGGCCSQGACCYESDVCCLLFASFFAWRAPASVPVLVVSLPLQAVTERSSNSVQP